MRADFAFRESWHLAAPVAAVHDVLLDLQHYPEWWPQVVAVASLGPEDARVLCRSALPYTLDLVLRAVSRSSERLEVQVFGDLRGSACFTLSPTGSGTRVDYAQRVGVTGWWLGAASRVARPLLCWNHDRMMRGCQRGLRNRLAG